MLKKTLILLLMVISVLLFVSCESNKITEAEYQNSPITSLEKKSVPTGGLEEAVPSPMLNALNNKLEAYGAKYRVALAEWITPANSGLSGRTVFASNLGNKQLSAHWVPGDLRRFGSRNIYWAKEQLEGIPTGVSLADANDAIDRAMQTWQDVQCSEIPLVENTSFPADLDLGIVQYFLGFGGANFWLADITHAGWLPRSFFDSLATGGGDYIIGVTFTYVWVDGGMPTDIDNNDKMDVALREIYYNNNFSWAIDALYSDIDVESIVLHETGHGLSQAHFGTIFGTWANMKLHFAPEAVMNAVYIYSQQELLGTDEAGHCSIWGSWPLR